MTVLPIVRYPDARLRSPSVRVTAFDGGLRRLAGDLLDTMRAAPGVGITAPHVGILMRLVVIELSSRDGVRIYVNPVVEEASAELQRHVEGSVSMPGITEEVDRPARIRVRCQGLDGEERTEDADGFLATCLQHEIDQLDGIFWLHRLSRLKRVRAEKRFAKAGRNGA